MTDQEKAESAVKCYMELRDPVAKALIVDIATLLRNEREEVLGLIKAVVVEIKAGTIS
jgi:hypothetical protein